MRLNWKQSTNFKLKLNSVLFLLPSALIVHILRKLNLHSPCRAQAQYVRYNVKCSLKFNRKSQIVLITFYFKSLHYYNNFKILIALRYISRLCDTLQIRHYLRFNCVKYIPLLSSTLVSTLLLCQIYFSVFGCMIHNARDVSKRKLCNEML